MTENDVGDGGPVPMQYPEKARVRAAAFRATRLYPGPVGQVLSRELLAWEEFGYRFGNDSVMRELVDHVLATSQEAEAA